MQLRSKRSSTHKPAAYTPKHFRLFDAIQGRAEPRRDPRRRARRLRRHRLARERLGEERHPARLPHGRHRRHVGRRVSAVLRQSPPTRVKHFTAQSGVRIVPGGSSIRDGCYLGKGVTCMPPMYINAGAYVGDGTMVDSHALVGSCAQIGKNCHISAASQIGGVLEPVGALPVIIEDDVLVGGNCGVYEGSVVKRRAVLGTGTILNRSTPVYDLVAHRDLPRHRRRAAGHSRRSRGRRRLARRHQRPRQGLGHLALHAGDRQISRQRGPIRASSSKTFLR